MNHWILNEDAGKNTKIALRWSYSAKHLGIGGSFGKATGAPVVILAITHLELEDGKVIREWNVIDELSIWSQIHHHGLTNY